MGQTALSESLRSIEAEIAARQPERALILAQEVQTRYPRALAIQRVIGEVHLALRKTREAIGALDRALAGDPEDARACCARAIVQQIQGDSMGALAWYRRACDIRPNDQVLLSAYRELASSLNQPLYTPSRTGLARLYLRGDLYPHAIREWEAVLAERADSLEAQVGLAETLWRARGFQAAAERCRRLLMNSPSCVKALLILAAIEHDAGSGEEAQKLLGRVVELDPDMRIARELFADRLAANDRALSLFVFDEEPPAFRLASVPLAQSAARTATARPSVPSQPAAPQPRAPASQPLAPASQPLAPATAAPAAYATGAPAARSNALPPDFHRIFSETRNMLWSDEMEAQETQGRIPRAPAFDRSRADPFAHSQVVIPPALMNQGGSLEDTEARLSINFLNWLQAQGAVTQNAPGTGTLGNTGPVPLPTPPRPRLTSQPQGGSPYPFDAGTGPLPTGPLPPPTPEALRAMFAELGPDTASQRIVDADIVPAHAGDNWAPERLDDASTTAAATSGITELETGKLTASSPSPVLPEGLSGPLMPADSGDGNAHPVGSAAALGGGESPTTLEALERGFAGSGFTAFELHPGELAAIASHLPDDAPVEAPRAVAEESLAEAAAQASAPGVFEAATEPLPEPAATPETGVSPAPKSEPELERPAPDDYAGRLSLARRRRAAGHLNDALDEYRVILKNAPDLFGDVMRDLNESLDDAPDHPEVHRLLGDAHIRQGDYLSALEAYNRAVALTQAQGS